MLDLILYGLLTFFNLGITGYCVWKIHYLQQIMYNYIDVHFEELETHTGDKNREDEICGENFCEANREKICDVSTPNRRCEEFTEEEKSLLDDLEEESKEPLKELNAPYFLSTIQKDMLKGFREGKKVETVMEESLQKTLDIIDKSDASSVEEADEFALHQMNAQGLNYLAGILEILPHFEKQIEPELYERIQQKLSGVQENFMDFGDSGDFDEQKLKETLNGAQDTVDDFYHYMKQKVGNNVKPYLKDPNDLSEMI